MSVKRQEETTVLEKVREPKSYCCVIHNDDITTMDFVVMAIVKVFGKSTAEATLIMLNIHNNGCERVGFFCYDIAITKKQEMDTLAKAHNFPLTTTVEEA